MDSEIKMDSLITTLNNESSIEEEKVVVFTQECLFSESHNLMREIRRQGKLCDVTLKVNNLQVFCEFGKNIEIESPKTP